MSRVARVREEAGGGGPGLGLGRGPASSAALSVPPGAPGQVSQHGAQQESVFQLPCVCGHVSFASTFGELGLGLRSRPG